MAFTFNHSELHCIRYGDAHDPHLSDFTLWAKVRTTAAASRYALVKDDNSGTADGYFLYVNSNGGVQAGLGDGTTQVFKPGLTNGSVNDGQWHAIAATFDRDGELTVWYDANADGTADISGLVSAEIDNDDDLTIGGPSAGSGNYFSGDIAGAAIWMRVLPADVLTRLAQGASPLFFPRNMAFYADLVRSPRDRFGHGATVSGATVTAHPRMVVPAPLLGCMGAGESLGDPGHGQGDLPALPGGSAIFGSSVIRAARRVA